jgi:hypothetical protein
MDPSKKIASRSAERAEKNNTLTIMVLGSVGRIRSFKVSRRGIIGAVIFILLYVPASIYLINEFFELRHNYKVQGTILDETNRELLELNQSLIKSDQHLALLNDYIQDLQAFVSREPETSSSPVESTVSQEVEETGEKEVSAVKETDTLQTGFGDSVVVEDVVIQKEGAQMTVAFKLSNTQPDENTVGGYVHIIAESESNDRRKLWSYPKETLKDGLPSNFRRGELFYIKRFKQIIGKIDLGSDQIKPTSIKVLVYSQPGTLIYEKEYEVSNAT